MPPSVKVRSADDAVRNRRESAAESVIAHLGNQLPDLSLLCYFDNEDWQALKAEGGLANRGVYLPIGKGTPSWWPSAPDYVRECLVVAGQRAFDHLIYLHGTTCSNAVGLTMTFAHELQHFVQYGNARRLWAANTIIPKLPKPVIKALGLTWCDVPHEREARIVSKRTAERLLGAEVVRQYIDAKITEIVTPDDAADWECIRGLVTSTPYDLAHETSVLSLKFVYTSGPS